MSGPKYVYEFHDGEEWLLGHGEFNTAEEAKQAGIDAGYEYVRVAPTAPQEGD